MTDVNAVGDAGTAAGDVIVLAAEHAPNRARLRFPEVSLIEAILEDAVRCLQRVSRGVTHRQFLEAFEWFESNRCDWPFAFVNVCDVLGMDPAAVRTRLRIVTKRPDEISRSSVTRPADARAHVAWTSPFMVMTS
jgi:hypothetical protein